MRGKQIICLNKIEMMRPQALWAFQKKGKWRSLWGDTVIRSGTAAKRRWEPTCWSIISNLIQSVHWQDLFCQRYFDKCLNPSWRRRFNIWKQLGYNEKCNISFWPMNIISDMWCLYICSRYRKYVSAWIICLPDWTSHK